jgi:hypothetical protein
MIRKKIIKKHPPQRRVFQYYGRIFAIRDDNRDSLQIVVSTDMKSKFMNIIICVRNPLR